MHRKYTQNQNHFPNLFLNDLTLCPLKAKFKKAHKKHIHSYWLKYLILKLIHLDKATNLRELIRILRDQGGYEKSLIQIVLGSLHIEDHNGTIEFKNFVANQSYDEKRLQLSSRGEFLLKDSYGAEFCFGYRYLSSIVDDYLLAFPKSIYKRMIQTDIDFEHLYAKGTDYSKKCVPFIEQRSIAVASFITVLKASWSIEIDQIHQNIFNDIDKDLIKPDFIGIETSLCDSISHITASLKFDTDSHIERLKKIMSSDGKVYLDSHKELNSYYAEKIYVS